MSQNKVVGSFVLLFALFFGVGLQFVDGQSGYAGLSPKFLATVVAIGLTICGVLIFARSDSVFKQSEDAATAIGPEHRFKRLALLIGGLAGHLLLISFLGFVLTSGLLMCSVAYAYGNQKVLRNFLIGIAIALPIWAIFTQILSLNLPLLPLLEKIKV